MAEPKPKKASKKRDILEVLETMLFDTSKNKTEPKPTCRTTLQVEDELEPSTGVHRVPDEKKQDDDTDDDYHDGFSDKE